MSDLAGDDCPATAPLPGHICVAGLANKAGAAWLSHYAWTAWWPTGTGWP